MDSAAINSFIPSLDQVDSWYEIFTLLPILIALELLLSVPFSEFSISEFKKTLDKNKYIK